MGTKSSIEWTDATWNPTRGCSMAKGSEKGGCLNCYAARMASRNLQGLKSPTTGEPFARILASGPRWTGKVELIEKALTLPLTWKKPKRVFVNSMSDLFHEALSDKDIDRVFAIMALCPHITFQVLTKRPERMLAYFDLDRESAISKDTRQFDLRGMVVNVRARQVLIKAGLLPKDEFTEEANRFIDGNSPWLHASGPMMRWPLCNVHIGVSVEDQATADARIPLLLRTPAAVRFVSYEPALGPVDFTRIKTGPGFVDSLTGELADIGFGASPNGWPHIDQIIIGGESGPGARPFDIAWARGTIRQCRAAGVAVFVKQLGAQPWDSGDGDDRPNAGNRLLLKDRKGGNTAKWPEDLRVREFPAVAR